MSWIKTAQDYIKNLLKSAANPSLAQTSDMAQQQALANNNANLSTIQQMQASGTLNPAQANEALLKTNEITAANQKAIADQNRIAEIERQRQIMSEIDAKQKQIDEYNAYKDAIKKANKQSTLGTIIKGVSTAIGGGAGALLGGPAGLGIGLQAGSSLGNLASYGFTKNPEDIDAGFASLVQGMTAGSNLLSTQKEGEAYTQILNARKDLTPEQRTNLSIMLGTNTDPQSILEMIKKWQQNNGTPTAPVQGINQGTIPKKPYLENTYYLTDIPNALP